MVRQGGRSRACEPCKKRRIKCDEQVPECGECLRAGKVCPGPLQGTLFIDIVGHKARPKAAIRDTRPGFPTVTPSINQSRITTPLQIAGPNSQRPLTPAGVALPGDSHVITKSDRSSHVCLPTPYTYEPSKAAPFQDLFIDTFLKSFFNPRSREDEWTHTIPNFLAKPKSDAIIHAIRAASMSVYGKKTGNQPIQVEACRSYAKGIKSQLAESRVNQQKLIAGVDADKIYDAEAVCVPMMFCFFEAMMCTSFAAWAQHSMAAGKMLEMLGPQRCRDGILHYLFRSVRITTIYYGITWQQPSFMSSADWCSIPFLTHKKSPLDRVNDILLQTPDCMKLRTDMIDAEAQGLDEGLEMLRERLCNMASGLLSRLEVYWELYREEVDTLYDHGQYFEVSDFSSDPEDWIVTAPADVDFHDASAATIIPHFDAAIAIMSGFLTASSPTEQARLVHGKRKAIHCASILEAVNWHSRQGPMSGGDHSIVVALKIVLHVSPSEIQKDKTRELLAKWGKARGVEGIATVWGSRLAGAFAPRFNPWEPQNHFYG